MNEDQAKALRAPFPQEVIDLLPRVWCPQCRDANKQKRPACDNHQRKRCNDCGNNITEAHLHLSYVGHATTTDRLLAVDPEWSWEPVAFSEQTGLPQLDSGGGLWIRLTVAGVTRLGYGHADGKNGGDAVKEAIGDALRNAAMRFGVAIDLWAKHDKPEAAVTEPAVGRGDPPAQRTGSRQQRATADGPKPDGPSPDTLRTTVKGIAKAKGTTYEVLAGLYYKGTERDLDHEQESGRIQQFIDAIHADRVPIPADEPAGASQ